MHQYVGVNVWEHCIVLYLGIYEYEYLWGMHILEYIYIFFSLTGVGCNNMQVSISKLGLLPVGWVVSTGQSISISVYVGLYWLKSALAKWQRVMMNELSLHFKTLHKHSQRHRYLQASMCDETFKAYFLQTYCQHL